MSPCHSTRPSILSIAVGVALSAAVAGTAAQGASSPGAMKGAAGASALAPADKAFMEKAAIAGMAEVELGKLAKDKASNDQVKQFGAHMVEDHSKANDELKKIAGTKGVSLPSDLDAKHKDKMAKLQKLSGAQFDRAYMDDMVAGHKEVAADFRKESTGGKDGDVKAFAAKTLPTLEDHLKMAQSTDAAVKKAK